MENLMTLNDYYLKYSTYVKDIRSNKELLKLNKFKYDIYKKTNYNKNTIDSLLKNYYLKFNSLVNLNVPILDTVKVITNNSSIIGDLFDQKDISSCFYSNSFFENIANNISDDDYYDWDWDFCFNNLIYEFLSIDGPLISCILVDLLEKKYNTNFLSLDRSMFKDQSFSKCMSDSTIKELYKIFDRSEFYLYYIKNNFNRPWKIYKAKVTYSGTHLVKIKILNYNRKKVLELSTEDHNPSYLNSWMIAFNKEMLKDQLESIKQGRLKYVKLRIDNINSNIKNLESLIKIKKERLNKDEYNYIFKEEKIESTINNIINNIE